MKTYDIFYKGTRVGQIRADGNRVELDSPQEELLDFFFDVKENGIQVRGVKEVGNTIKETVQSVKLNEQNLDEFLGKLAGARYTWKEVNDAI